MFKKKKKKGKFWMVTSRAFGGNSKVWGNIWVLEHLGKFCTWFFSNLRGKFIPYEKEKLQNLCVVHKSSTALSTPFFACYIRENVSSTSKEKSLHVSSRSLSFSSQQTLFLNYPPFPVSSTSPSRPSHSWSTPMHSSILTSFKNSIHLPIATPLLCSLS